MLLKWGIYLAVLQIFLVSSSGRLVRKPRNDDYIIGGNTTRAGDDPWMARIFLKTDTKQTICGAVLIDHQWVVTAAHCVLEIKNIDPSTLLIGMGEYDVNERTSSKTYGVSLILWNKHYRKELKANGGNDIAVIKLDQKVVPNDSIKPVNLPPKGEDFINYTGRVVGWGVTDKDSLQATNVLQFLRVRIISNSECETRFRSYDEPTFKENPIDDTMLCAGVMDGVSDVCFGDSGGPLIVKSSGKSYLAGIVSWGFPCAHRNVPSVYTRVTNYLDWMNAAFEKYP